MPDLQQAQKLMDELISAGYDVPGPGKCQRYYGMTFLEFKTGLRCGGQEASDAQVIKWVKNYIRKNGKPPTNKSGLIGEADCGGLSWGALDMRLRTQGAASLFQFCVEHGLRGAPVEATDAQVINWIKVYAKKHGKPPVQKSGLIGEIDSGDLKWENLSDRLRKQGSSLFQFCVEHRLRAAKEIDETTIIKWVKNYTERNGELPTDKSGVISEVDSCELTWNALVARLWRQGSSLTLLRNKHGLR